MACHLPGSSRQLSTRRSRSTRRFRSQLMSRPRLAADRNTDAKHGHADPTPRSGPPVQGRAHPEVAPGGPQVLIRADSAGAPSLQAAHSSGGWCGAVSDSTYANPSSAGVAWAGVQVLVRVVSKSA